MKGGHMAEEKNETVTIRKDTLWKYSTFALLALLVIGAFFMFSGKSTTGNVVANNPGAVVVPSEKVNVAIGDAPTLGSSNAPVTIVEFTDYQCPFCGRAYLQTYPVIKSSYIDTGKVLYVAKDFPLTSIHPQAQKAAEAARCANEQGKFWEMHDKLFSNQESLSVENEKIWAGELGLDKTKFNTCLDSGKYTSAVQAEATQGQQLGVQGTPAFFVNGRIISGACPSQTFDQAIQAEIAGKKWSSNNCQVIVQ